MTVRPKGFEVLGRWGDKSAEHFVKKHGDAIKVANGVGFQTDLDIFDERGAQVVVEKVAFKEAVKVLRAPSLQWVLEPKHWKET